MDEAITTKQPFREFVRFLITGGANTFVDFAILNVLILIFGLSQGDPNYMYYKAIAFLAATTNSFILNKWWVFKNKSDASPKQIGSFLSVGVIGLILNTTVSTLVFNLATAIYPSTHIQLLANAGAVAGTLFVLLFNYTAYKYFVFKR